MEFNPIKVIITEEMLLNAKSRDHGKYNNKSFMDGKGNLHGFLGDELVKKLRPDLIWSSTKDYDFISPTGKKIEVKTKYQTVPNIKPEYEASVCNDSLHQQCDFYVFCRVYKTKDGSFPFGWVIGTISKDNYFKIAKPLKKADIDGSNKWEVTQNCYNIYYSQLSPFPLK